MKKTLTTHEIQMALHDNGFSYRGAEELAEYLEQLEQDTGDEMELDVVAFRCEYSEYDSLQDWAQDHFSDWKNDLDIEEEDDEDEIDEKIRTYLTYNTQLIEFDGGIIVQDF
jgi:hypothetical protein